MKSFTQKLRLFITGFFMGTADLVPGVSGGTIAYLSGIYEELIYSINQISGKTLKLALKSDYKPAIKSVPWKFLTPLLLGLFTAIFTLADLLSHLIETQGRFVWALFFGLVASSTYVVIRRVSKWDMSDVIAFVITSILTFLLMGSGTVSTPNTYPFLFLSGAIAICAMILPGISGSFILVLLGKYQYILDSVTERRLLTLVVFAAGCVVGLALFSRVLRWLFSKHHDISVAILSGFMLGSLRVIWPFETQPGESIHWLVWILVALGIIIVLALERLGLTSDKTADIDDREFTQELKQSTQDEK